MPVNLLSLTSVVGKTNCVRVSTSATTILTNEAGSNQLYKINSLYACNRNTSLADSPNAIDVELVRTPYVYKLSQTINVANGNTLIIVGKESAIYLEEGDSIRAIASDTDGFDCVISYEILE